MALVEYSPAIKRNKLLITAATWMDLIGIILSEENDKIIDMENRGVVAKGQGRWGKGWV